ncbi:hypothetical protein [Pricia sp.]|uniref:hypothetical protein n=1 Tax=Pricia sp. TaxID=2268138 RepID=UPI003593DE23
MSVPIRVRYLFNLTGRNYLETGLGYTWINVAEDFKNGHRGRHNGIASIGFRRYFGRNGDWLWKADFSPILTGSGGKKGNTSIKVKFSPMVGIAIGKKF